MRRRLVDVHAESSIKLGLKRMIRLIGRSDAITGSFMKGNLPELSTPPKIVHVAGTNGKGTVAFKVERSLLWRKVGRIGVFTSPHVGSVRERIRVNGELVSSTSMEDLLSEVDSLVENVEADQPTYFETLTLMALLHFAHSRCTYVVLEAGMGGRDDSTNVFPYADVCVITSIGMDHTDFLGDSLEKITMAKAGIFKKDSHVVIGPSIPTRDLLEQQALRVGAKSFSEIPPCNNIDLANSRIAGKVLELLGIEPLPAEELLDLRPPGRYEYFPDQNIVLDGSHNPDAFAKLASNLFAKFGRTPLVIICAMSKNKDVRGCIASLNNPGLNIEKIVFAKHENESRSSSAHEMVALASGILSNVILDSADTVLDAFMNETGVGSERVLVVCGSFNALGKIRKKLVPEMPLDEINLNER